MTRAIEAVDQRVVQGSNFRVPAIEGLGSGHGFRITNLRLPVGWEKIIPVLQPLDSENFQTALMEYCQARCLPAAESVFDPQTGVLTEISIQTTPPSVLTLKNPYDLKTYSTAGSYSSPQEIPNLQAATALLRFAGHFLNIIDEEIGAPKHSYIDTHVYPERITDFLWIWGRSVNLRLPGKFFQAEEDLFDRDYRRYFYDEARNIIGRFGLEPYLSIDFREKALLKYITLGYGGRDYSLCQTEGSSEQGSYRPFSGSRAENHTWITDPEAAAALHGVIALYINTLLDWQERRGSGRWEAPSEKYIPRGW